MGIQGLQGFIKANQSFWNKQALHDTKLVIDANNFLVTLYSEMCTSKNYNHHRQDIYGGNMVAYSERVRCMFDKLKKCNIEPILVSDGAVLVKRSTKNWQTIISEGLTKASERFKVSRLISESNPGEKLAMNTCLNVVFKLVIDELDIKRIRTAYEADGHAARIANEHNCPLLSNDSDFVIMPVRAGYILIENLLHNEPKVRATNGSASQTNSQYYLECSVFHQSKMLQNFTGLKEELLPLVGALLSCPFGQTPPYDWLITFTKAYYSGPLVAKSYAHRRLANLLNWLAKYSSIDRAIEGLLNQKRVATYQADKIRLELLDLVQNHMIQEDQDVIKELEIIYAPEDYHLEAKPAKFIKQLVTEDDLPGTMLDLVFQKPYFEKAVVDDLQLPSSNRVKWRPISVAIALLRPKSQTINKVDLDNEKNPTPSNGDKESNLGKSVAKSNFDWKFEIYDREAGVSGLKKFEIFALDQLDGYGPLTKTHVGTTMSMSNDEKFHVLLATFHWQEDRDWKKMDNLVGHLFKGQIREEARICFLLIKFAALDSKIRPMGEFLEANLLSLVYYAIQRKGLSEEHFNEQQIETIRLTLEEFENGNSELISFNPKFRTIMHLISQLTAAYWSLACINSILKHPIQVCRLDQFLNCTLIYRLTAAFHSKNLKFEDTCELSPILIDTLEDVSRFILGK